MISSILLICIAASAILAIYYRQKEELNKFAILKPLTTVLVICLALYFYQSSANLTYSKLVIAGLVAALIGDVFLLKDKDFVKGLVSFLLAHILFTVAFSNLYGFQLNIIVLSSLLLVGLVYYKFLYNSLNEFVVPVALYFIAIIIMDWQAISLMASKQTLAFNLIGVGAVLFTLSDAVIAYDKFKKELSIGQALILSTYWAAIVLICLSIKYIN